MFGIPVTSSGAGKLKVDLLHFVSTEKNFMKSKKFDDLSSPRPLNIDIYLCPTAKATGQGQEQLRLSDTDVRQDRASCTPNCLS